VSDKFSLKRLICEKKQAKAKLKIDNLPLIKTYYKFNFFSVIFIFFLKKRLKQNYRFVLKMVSTN